MYPETGPFTLSMEDKCVLSSEYIALSVELCVCVLSAYFILPFIHSFTCISLNLIFHLCNKDSILLVNRSLLFFCGQMLHSSLSYELSTDKNSDQCSNQLTSRSPFPLFPNFRSLFSYLFLCHWQTVSHSLTCFFVCLCFW